MENRAIWKTCSRALLFWMGLVPISVLAQPKPLLVVSVAPLEQLVSKAQHLAQLAGLPQSAEMVQHMARNYTQGLDPKRPILGLVQADENSFQIIGFLPLSDAAAWLRSLPWANAVQDVGNDILQIQLGRQQIFVKTAGNWTLLSNTQDGLRLAPDPSQLIAGGDAEFDVGVRALVRNIPAGPRDAALQQMSGMLQFSMQQQATSATPAEQRLNTASLERTIRSLRQFATEGDLLSAGLKIDPESEKIWLDSSLVPVAGTPLHRRYSTWGKARTRLSSFFVPKASVAMAAAYRLTPEEQVEQATQLDLAKDALVEKIVGDGNSSKSKWTPEARQALQSIADEVTKLAKSVSENGQMDSVASAIVMEGGLAIIAASQTAAKGDTAHAILVRIVDLARKLELPIDAKMDFHSQNGVRFHAAQITLPKEVDLSAAFGEKLNVYVATADEFLFVGVGDKSLSALRKSAMATMADSSGKNAIPLRFLLSLGQVAQLAAEMTQDGRVQVVAERLKGMGNQDHILVSQKIEKNGTLGTRIELQEGIIAALGEVYGAQVAPGAAPR